MKKACRKQREGSNNVPDVATQSTIEKKPKNKIKSTSEESQFSTEPPYVQSEVGLDDLELMLEVDIALKKEGSVRDKEELAVLVNEIRENLTPPKPPISKNVLSRKIRAVEKRFFCGNGSTLFERKSGANAPDDTSGHWQKHGKPAAAAQAELILQEIRKTLHGLQNICSFIQKPIIRIGCSPTTTSLVEKACQDFHKNNTLAPCEIFLHNDLPQILRREGTGDGKYDIVVASCSPTSLLKGGRKKIGSLLLEPQLLMHRGNKLAKKFQINWNDLDGWLILVPSDNRWPKPILAHDLCPASVRQEPFDHYREALATVRAGGKQSKMACIAYSDLHSVEELSSLRSFPMDELDAKLELGAFLSTSVPDNYSPLKKELMENLGQCIGNQLSSLQFTILQRPKQPSFPSGRMATFHVKRDKETNGKSNLIWVPGRLNHLSVHPSGFFEAEHLIIDRNEEKESCEYHVRGDILRSAQGLHQLSWVGKIIDEDSNYQECYFCSFLFRDSTLYSDTPIVGFWSGVTKNQGKPDAGYMILLPRAGGEFFSSDRSTQELNEIVRNYRMEDHFNGMGLQLPKVLEQEEHEQITVKPR